MTKKTRNSQDSKKLTETIVDGIQEVKGKDIVVLDLRDIDHAICDFFVICSGESSTQVEGIANSIRKETSKKLKEKPFNEEGKRNAEWVLLDYVSVVAHIFYKEKREYYNLEDLWADAKREEVPNLA